MEVQDENSNIKDHKGIEEVDDLFNEETGGTANFTSESGEPPSDNTENIAEEKIHVSGQGSIVLEEPEVESLEINNVGRDVINNYLGTSVKFKKGDKFPCPHCKEEIVFASYGRQVCPHKTNCGRPFTLRNRDFEKEIVVYDTLSQDEIKRYAKLLANINNNLIDNRYDIALQYCRKAEELAPGEVATWVYYSLTEFMHEIKKDYSERKSVHLIVKSIKNHIDKCKLHGMSEEECATLKMEIARRLFKVERERINSVQSKQRDHLNNPKWTSFNLSYILKRLESFDVCFQLSKNTEYLQAYVEELAKSYKWIVRTADGELINTRACGPFNAVKKLKDLIDKITDANSDFEMPDIAEERMNILKVQNFHIKSIIPKS